MADVTFAKLRDQADVIGSEIHRLIAVLYPICRSITGNGVRETLRILQARIPLIIHEVASGTPVFDWTVPREWNIRDAYVKNSRGERVIDFQKSNLHIMSYSVPVHTSMPLAELREHLFTIPDRPHVIPYRTSYFNENWGFCLSHEQLQRLPEDQYEVFIDSSLTNGNLTYGECFIPGSTVDEVLISSHVCHPSLGNDNLSGVALTAELARRLLTVEERRYSYRFLFIPGTIGSITWLARNEARVEAIRHGLVLACLGDSGPSTYKKSRRGNAEIDRVVQSVLAESGAPHTIVEFSPYGYDERQFCSPGFDLPVGCLMRTPHGQFAEYHTSADNVDFVRPDCLADSFRKCVTILAVLEGNRTYRNRNAKCEPQLGRRGLYRSIGGQADTQSRELALLWVLNLSDGKHSLLDIAGRSGLPFATVEAATVLLVGHGLLVEDSPAATERRSTP